MTENWSPPEPDTPPAVAAQAWFLRLTSSEATEADVDRLRAWLAQEPTHQFAYDQVRDTWHGLGPLAGRQPVAANDGGSLRHRSLALSGALAAGVALFFAWPNLSVLGADISTRPGEMREITLPDGGKAWLDTDSAIDLAFNDRSRTVIIRKGQAWFDVADEARPFVVRSHDSTITDIGTVFGVRRAGDETRVFVREGEVRVACAGDEAAVLPGRTATCEPTGISGHGAADIDAASSWQSGRLVFTDRRLGEILAEIDRYQPGMMLIDLPAAEKARRVTAFLEVDQIDRGLDALAASEGLRLRRLGPVLVVQDG